MAKYKVRRAITMAEDIEIEIEDGEEYTDKELIEIAEQDHDDEDWEEVFSEISFYEVEKIIEP